MFCFYQHGDKKAADVKVWKKICIHKIDEFTMLNKKIFH